MNVALPEVDGRIVTRAVSFKAEARFDALTECPIVGLRPEGGPGRVRCRSRTRVDRSRCDRGRGTQGRHRARQLPEPRRAPRERGRARHSGRNRRAPSCARRRGVPGGERSGARQRPHRGDRGRSDQCGSGGARDPGAALPRRLSRILRRPPRGGARGGRGALGATGGRPVLHRRGRGGGPGRGRVRGGVRGAGASVRQRRGRAPAGARLPHRPHRHLPRPGSRSPRTAISPSTRGSGPGCTPSCTWASTETSNGCPERPSPSPRSASRRRRSVPFPTSIPSSSTTRARGPRRSAAPRPSSSTTSPPRSPGPRATVLSPSSNASSTSTTRRPGWIRGGSRSSGTRSSSWSRASGSIGTAASHPGRRPARPSPSSTLISASSRRCRSATACTYSVAVRTRSGFSTFSSPSSASRAARMRGRAPRSPVCLPATSGSKDSIPWTATSERGGAGSDPPRSRTRSTVRGVGVRGGPRAIPSNGSRRSPARSSAGAVRVRRHGQEPGRCWRRCTIGSGPRSRRARRRRSGGC